MKKQSGSSTPPRRITRDLYKQIAAAYRERPRIGYVQRSLGVGYKMVRKAVDEGWPEFGFPPLGRPVPPEDRDKPGNGSHVQPSTVDFSHTGPDDAARVALDSSIAVAQMVQRCAADVTSRFERGEAVAIGDITPKLVGELARAMYTSNELLKRAIELQQQQQPNERQAFWIKLGELIDRCTPEEQDLLAKTGELPAHLTGGYTFLSHDDDA